MNKVHIQYQFETGEKGIGFFENASNTMVGDLQIIDLEGDGISEYLARGSIDGAAVFDKKGKRLWSYGEFTVEKTSIDDMASGDVDGDGVDEFVASWDAIELFDRNGALKWRQESKFGASHIDIVDTDGNGTNEIAYSSMGELLIRNEKGEMVSEVEMPFYLSQFITLPQPDKKQAGILAIQDGYLWITDFKGKVIAKFAAPLSELDTAPFQTPVGESSGTSVYRARGAWVRLKKGEPAHLVVITQFAAIDRSVLYIFKLSGEIVYQEVLPEECSSIAILPGATDDDSQRVLIGGEKTIWRYHAR